MNKLAIIDADSLCYTSSKEMLEESINILDEKIQNIFFKTEATHYVMFLTMGDSFRKNIDPNYKVNRKKYPTQLKWIKTLKSYLIENWDAQWMEKVEADDLVSYWYNISLIYGKLYVNSELKNFTFRNLAYNQEPEEIQKIICSPDKDLLKSIPGKHFNYSYKLENKEDPNSIIKGWWIETLEIDSKINFWSHAVTGDMSDNIKGIENKGIKFFESIFAWSEKYEEDIKEVVFREYLNNYGISKGIYEFQKNYRLLHLLDCNEDFIREIGVLPQFPKINEVPKINNEVIDI